MEIFIRKCCFAYKITLIINSKGFIYIQDFAFYSKSNFDICSVTDSMKQKFLIFLANITYEIGTNCFLVLLGNN